MTRLVLGELARAVEVAQARVQLGLATEHLVIGSGFALWGGPGSFLNKAVAIEHAPVDDAALDVLAHFYQSRGAPPKLVVTSFASPELLARLAARGFRLRRTGTVLARDPEGELPRLGDSSARIRRLPPSDIEGLRAFARVVERGFAEEHDPGFEAAVEARARFAASPLHDAFIAVIDGAIVGAAAATSGEGVTVLLAASVAPEHRKRGIQGALMRARIERARARGSRAAVVAALPGVATARNAIRLGFEVAYARLELTLKEG